MDPESLMVPVWWERPGSRYHSVVHFVSSKVGSKGRWLCFGCMRKGRKPPVHWDGELVERKDNGKNGYAILIALYSGLLKV